MCCPLFKLFATRSHTEQARATFQPMSWLACCNKNKVCVNVLHAEGSLQQRVNIAAAEPGAEVCRAVGPRHLRMCTTDTRSEGKHAAPRQSQKRRHPLSLQGSRQARDHRTNSGRCCHTASRNCCRSAGSSRNCNSACGPPNASGCSACAVAPFAPADLPMLPPCTAVLRATGTCKSCRLHCRQFQSLMPSSVLCWLLTLTSQTAYSCKPCMSVRNRSST